MSTTGAIVLGAVVIVAIGGFILYQYVESQRRAERESDPWRLVGGGVGNLITGIGDLVT